MLSLFCSTKEHFASPWKFGFRGESFVTSFSEGMLLFVTKCDEGEGEPGELKIA